MYAGYTAISKTPVLMLRILHRCTILLYTDIQIIEEINRNFLFLQTGEL